jgi:hypothetical protein
VNASAPAITREDEVHSKIRKVRAFSHTARIVCSAAFGFGLVGSLVMLLFIVLGPKLGTVEHRVWAGFAFAAMISLWLTGVHQLYRLFGNLATGAIFTSENIRRLRRLGILWLMAPLLSIAISFISTEVFSLDLVNAVPVKGVFELPSTSELLSSFISAGLVLFASWIMDVGLYEKDHADALQRDADLVI